MQRNMDLIRLIVLNTECGKPYPEIIGFTPEAVKYHQMLAIESGLLNGTHGKYNENATEVPSYVIVEDITWEGHNFIDAIREDNNWNKVKVYLTQEGKQLSIETIKIAVKTLLGFG
jgi:Hypothetical protein (DUF2513)